MLFGTKRRVRTLTLAVTAAAAVGLAGCGGGSDSSGGSNGSEEASAPATTVGGTLRYVTGIEPPSLNPVVVANRLPQNIAFAVIERLVDKSADNEPSFDGLVTEVARVDDDTFSATIREGVTFTNGETFDAEAVKYSMDQQKATPGGVNLGGTVDAVRVTSPTTVEFDVLQPTSQNAMIAMMTEVFAIPPKYYEDEGPDKFGRAPIGTGPFKFVRWQSGREITLERNDDFWRETAKLDGIRVTFNKSDSGRVALVKAGDADITGPVAPAVFRGAEGPGIRTAERDGALMSFLGFSREAPVNDEKLREAASQAVDRDAIANRVLMGQATPRRTLFYPQFDNDSNTDYAPAFDAEKAKEVGSGLGNPSVTLSYPSGAYPLDTQIGQAVAQSLTDVGLQVTQEPTEQAAFTTRWVANELKGVFLAYYELRYPDLSYFGNSFFSSKGVFKYCASPELDKLGAEARSEDDAEQAQALYDQMLEDVVAKQRCMIPLYQLKDNYTMTDKIEGFNARFDQTFSWAQLGLSTQQ